jgi:vanillin dehydrogenase
LSSGVLNVVTNDIKDAGPIVSALVSDPQVRVVNFTGSTKVGRIIATEAARNLKPSIMELGGKNALIILKDADIEYAVKAAVHGAYMNSGQICMSTDRIKVLESAGSRT